ncbi:hypothetical protein ABZY58_11240 [Micromonospora tulbaghiae]|uniref:hypothetical protein n=1 Tax=Micromonospora tulbaghiae TaxID=479978 RepID=UPI0033A284AC
MRNAVLSASGQFTEQPAKPTPHTPWCQPQHCAAFPGLDATHRHKIGEVDGAEVWVERSDTTRPDGRVDYGTPGVHLYCQGTLPLESGDALIAMVNTARVFAAELAEVR